MGEQTFHKYILAVITMKPEQVKDGSTVFIVKDRETLERKAGLLEKILDGIAHDLDDDTMIIVKH